MAVSFDAPGARLLRLWSRLAPWPCGPWLFSRLLSVMVPYTGTIRPRVRVLEPGHAVVTIGDRRAVRNHLRSVHAIALANLAEAASGLALLAGLPPGVRGILTGISISYLKKARGTLVAESRVVIPEVHAAIEHRSLATIRDATGEAVAEAVATWRLAPT